MKKMMMLAVLACTAFTFACASKNEKITEGNPNKLDTLSYCIGADLGMGYKYQFGQVGFNVEEVKGGIKDGLLQKSDVEPADALSQIQEFFSKTMAERRSDFEQLYAKDTTAVFNAFASEAETKEISYALGVCTGDNLRQSPNFKLQYYWVFKAFDDAQVEDGLVVPMEELSAFMQHYFTVVIPQEAEERSKAWLAKKEKASGVKKTESGLLYQIVEAGDMSKAATKDEDVVRVHYVGKLNDGKVFDASRFADRDEDQKKMMRQQYPSLFDEKGNPIREDEPIEFPLGGVIKGWTEGMKLIGPGGKIKLYIPAELAYGRRGAGELIGANEALEFVVELLEVIPAQAAEEAPATEGETPVTE